MFPTLDAPPPHAPVTFEDHLVAASAIEAGCAPEGQSLVPPDPSCPENVHALYRYGQMHLFTAILSLVFLAVLLSMTFAIFSKGGHH